MEAHTSSNFALTFLILVSIQNQNPVKKTFECKVTDFFLLPLAISGQLKC